MSRPKRKTVASMMAEAELSPDDAVASSIDNAIQPSRDQAVELAGVAPVALGRPARDRRGRPGDTVRNGYHASVYLPKEAQFAVREIALHLRHVKPHAVFLEAFADLFDKYHKPDLAAECRNRIDPRDGAME